MWLFILFYIFSLAQSHGPVLVQLNSKWPLYSFVRQTSEYFAEHHYKKYWSFLKEASKIDFRAINPCSIQDYEFAINLTEKIFPQNIDLIKFSLSIYESLPKIEFYQNVASDQGAVLKCSNVFQVADEFVCGWNAFESKLSNCLNDNLKSKLNAWDRIYNLTSVSDKTPIVRYFQDITHPEFSTHHSKLIELANEEKIRYVFSSISKIPCQESARLPGYNAILTIKDTTYMAVDDQEINMYGESIPAILTNFTSKNSEIPNSIKKPEDISDLFEVIVTYLQKFNSDERMSELIEIVQNLPLYLEKLTSIKMTNEDRRKFNFLSQEIYKFLESNNEYIFLNGVPIKEETSPFQLIPILANELSTLHSLKQLSFTPLECFKIISKSVSYEKNSYLIDVRSDNILWLNNLEKDSRYRGMSRDPQQFFYFMFGETFYPVRLNIFNVVLFLNTSSPTFFSQLHIVQRIIINNIPIRFGIVLVTNISDPDSLAFSRAFSFLMLKSKTLSAIKFMEEIFESGSLPSASVISDIYRSYDARDYLIINTPIHSSDSFIAANNDFFYTLVSNYREIVNELRDKLSSGFRISSKTHESFMSGPNYHNRANLKVINHFKNIGYVDIPTLNDCSLDVLKQLDPSKTYYCLIKNVPYLTCPSDATQTVWLILNFEAEGLTFLKDLLKKPLPSKVRFGIVFSHIPSTQESTVTDMIGQLLDSQDPLTSIKKFLDNPDNQENFKGSLQNSRSKFDSHVYFKKLFGIFDSYSYIIHGNGKYGPIHEENFVPEDIHLSTSLHSTIFAPLFKDIDKVIDQNQNKLNLTKIDMFDIITNLISYKIGNNLKNLPFFSKKHDHISLQIQPKTDDVFINIVAFIDPLSETAQKWIPILKTLSLSLNTKIIIYLVKGNSNTFRFSRFVLEPFIKFKEGKVDDLHNTAVFETLPSDNFHTLHIEALQSWFIKGTLSNCDMDNILLKKSDIGCIGVYLLESLMFEGHAFDLKQEAPASGLKLVMGSVSNPQMFDTIVIHNLGYFQFKAHPGSFFLNIKQTTPPQLFAIDSVTSLETGTSDMIVIDSYHGQLVKVYVRTIQFTESDTIQQTQWWSKISKYFSSSNPSTSSDQINIFSVATGHLYERFMRIMILSVLRHKKTKTPVKFWFLGNFVSPQFRKSIEILSKHYDFKYEFVQYQWPHWLLKQTDKQRIIWGYKILFLDVLFPLDIDRIIFVDADQIVRADLNELYTMNLGDAPYAYTPFCDDRPEMESFRFWKRGYWSNHLRGKPYHISALYLVDLKKFREMMAGDRLRGQYQILSRDPNSLANLDQDLPNNIQDVVPIKSLPINWLWCETWCSDQSKSEAKTIDMCNNPLTHEAKLQRAKRIAPEFTEYDDIIYDILRNATSPSVDDIKEDL